MPAPLASENLELLTVLPGTLPVVEAPRALATSPAQLAWRAGRPGVASYADPSTGTLSVRLRHRGLPLDALLTTGSGDQMGSLQLPRPAAWVPRLYAGFGGRVRGGFPVPEALRPSPLEYIVRVLGDPALLEPVSRYLSARRFEFLDFDVV